MGFLKKIFRTKAKPEEISPDGGMTFETGASNNIKNIYELAQADTAYAPKGTLLKGCVHAFAEGRPQPLQAFLKGYLEFKRERGALAQMMTETLDDGITNLVARPAMLLAEKSEKPKEVLETLAAELSPYFKSVFYDFILRRACVEGSWPVGKAALELGADPNAANGLPLLNAASVNDYRLVEILISHGAKIDLIRVSKLSEAQQKAMRSLYLKVSGTPESLPPETAPNPPAAGKTDRFRL